MHDTDINHNTMITTKVVIHHNHGVLLLRLAFLLMWTGVLFYFYKRQHGFMRFHQGPFPSMIDIVAGIIAILSTWFVLISGPEKRTFGNYL